MCLAPCFSQASGGVSPHPPGTVFCAIIMFSRSAIYEAAEKGDLVRVQSAVDGSCFCRGMDPNARTDYRETLLHRACAKDQAHVVSWLIAREDVDVNAKELRGIPPCLFACTHGAVGSLKVLVSCPRVNWSEPPYAVHRVIDGHHYHDRALPSLGLLLEVDNAKAIFNAPDPEHYNWTPLHAAVAQLDKGGIVEWLLQSGLVDVVAFDNNGDAPLHLTIRTAGTPLPTIQALLSAGASPMQRQAVTLDTALHVAALANRPDVVGLLLESDPDVDAPNKASRRAEDMPPPPPNKIRQLLDVSGGGGDDGDGGGGDLDGGDSIEMHWNGRDKGGGGDNDAL
jgi:ankyrin repeat protein